MKNIEKSKKGRIINVSSRAHTRGIMAFDDLQWEKREYSSTKAYEQSKLANVYFTRHLATLLPENVKTVSLHPGVVRTELGRYIFDFYPWI
jgi:retinol dehydrogenase-12